MERLGITIGMEGTPLRDSLEQVHRAESLGFTDAWSSEAGGPDGLTPLAALAVATDRLRLGTGILPVFTRPPALLAMEAAALADLSGGRFVLGLGTSSRIIVERWMGGRFDKPLTRLREYVRVLRSALAGEKTSFDGATVRSEGFRLQHGAGAQVPIYLAALGPAACRLAGEVADGIVFYLKTTEGVRRGLEQAAAGAAAGGRHLDPFEAVIRLPVVLGDDQAAVERVARRTIVSYALVDVYNRSLADQGFEAEAAAIGKAWAEGDRHAALEAVSTAMIEALLVSGEAAEAGAKIAAFRQAGIGTPVLLPIPTAEDPVEARAQVEGMIEALAPR